MSNWWLNEMSNQLTESVDFLGNLSPDGVANALRSASCLVIPSDWGESFGLVAIEGIACGCHVIGSNDSGLPEAVGQAGVVVEKGSAAALSVALKDFSRGDGIVEKDIREQHLANFTFASFTERWRTKLNVKASSDGRDHALITIQRTTNCSTLVLQSPIWVFV